METGLMEIVRSLNRSWIYGTYFSLYRAIHPGGNVREGEMSGYSFRVSIRVSVVLGTYSKSGKYGTLTLTLQYLNQSKHTNYHLLCCRKNVYIYIYVYIYTFFLQMYICIPTNV